MKCLYKCRISVRYKSGEERTSRISINQHMEVLIVSDGDALEAGRKALKVANESPYSNDKTFSLREITIVSRVDG